LCRFAADPRYSRSPDFNPIEKCFGQIKRWCQRNREQARANVFTAITSAANSVTEANMRGYYRSCGDDLPKAAGESELLLLVAALV
jgi:hypothetical protein